MKLSNLALTLLVALFCVIEVHPAAALCPPNCAASSGGSCGNCGGTVTISAVDLTQDTVTPTPCAAVLGAGLTATNTISYSIPGGGSCCTGGTRTFSICEWIMDCNLAPPGLVAQACTVVTKSCTSGGPYNISTPGLFVAAGSFVPGDTFTYNLQVNDITATGCSTVCPNACSCAVTRCGTVGNSCCLTAL